MGGMGLEFTLVLVRRLLRPSSLVWAYDYIALLVGFIATPNSPIGRYNLPPASHPPLHPPHPLLTAHPFSICAIRDITVVVKGCSK